MTNDLIERLDTLVDSERDALLAGNLDRIGEILEQKRALADELSRQATDAEALRPYHAKLQRNAALYDSALAGIRRVVDRLGMLQERRKSLDTYDAKGRRQTISDVVEHRLEKRA